MLHLLLEVTAIGAAFTLGNRLMLFILEAILNPILFKIKLECRRGL